MQWGEETGDGCSRDRRFREYSLNVYRLWVPRHCLTGWASSPPFYWEGSRVFRASTELVEGGGGCGPQHLESSLPPDTQSLLETGRAGSWGSLVPQRCSLSEHSSGLKKKESADTLRCFWLCRWASQNRVSWKQRLSMLTRFIEAIILLCIKILNHSFVHLKLIWCCMSIILQ